MYVYLLLTRYDDSDPIEVSSHHIRPRARHRLSLQQVDIGRRVFINYNYDEPDSRGYWYDAVVTNKKITRTIKEVHATVYIGLVVSCLHVIAL